MAIFPSTASDTSAPSWKFWASIAALAFSIYKLITGPVAGDAIFPFIISLLLFFSEAKFIPKNFASNLRKIFKYGDNYARLCIFIIAIGGTALSIKLFAGLSLIPDYVDFWFKRSAPPLVSTAVILYISSILSKVTFYLSDVKIDVSVNRFEFLYYLCVIIFCISITTASMGVGYMDTAVTSQEDRVESPYIWDPKTLRILFCVTTVSLIWSICYGLCVVSRFCEWALRERYTSAESNQKDRLTLSDGNDKSQLEDG
ncbi:hypothetical protein GFM44_30860 [Rhizobium leguminosarum bv. viciae]|nr:hypothetical protein [Rhizobium leguminosarum bv. viciae]